MFEKGIYVSRAAQWMSLAVLALGSAVVQAAPGHAVAGNAGQAPAPGLTGAPGSTGYSHVKSLGGIDEYRLDSNGLTVLLAPDHSAPVVTFEVTYQVGSRNEVTGTTGATHILEHMMFKGSDAFNDAKGNSIKQMLERVGGALSACLRSGPGGRLPRRTRPSRRRSPRPARHAPSPRPDRVRRTHPACDQTLRRPAAAGYQRRDGRVGA